MTNETEETPAPAVAITDGDERKKEEEEEEDEEKKEKPQPTIVATNRGALPLDWTRVQPTRPAGLPTSNDDKDGVEGEAGGGRDDEEDHADSDEEPEHVVRFPWDVTEIDKDEDELMIVGTAGQKITRIGVDLDSHCSPKLKKLILRSHLIRTMEGLSGFGEMELLELYDNIVDKLQGLDEGVNGAPGINLRILDISYNVIRDMGPVQLCPNLRELYIANNKLKSIAGLKGLSQLVKVDLGANKIRVMDPDELSGLVNLEELWLGKNKIEKITGLEKLTKLRRLDVQNNRLTVVENLESQVDTLEELYLANNGLEDEGLCHPTGLGLRFTQLTMLDLSRNLIVSARPFEHLTGLEDLWLSGNKVETFDALEPLSSLTELTGIYLEYNPVADEFEYRKKLKEIVPSLTQIDATMVGGIAAYGMPSMNLAGVVETTEDRMRRLQNMAVERAKIHTAQLEAAKAQTTQDGDGEGKAKEDQNDNEGEGKA